MVGTQGRFGNYLSGAGHDYAVNSASLWKFERDFTPGKRGFAVDGAGDYGDYGSGTGDRAGKLSGLATIAAADLGGRQCGGLAN